MPSDPVSLAREWRRMRNVLRALLSLACMYAEILARGHDSFILVLATVAFASYAMLVLTWSRLDALQSSLAALFFETGFFVAFAVYGSDVHGWIGSFFFLYLMM